MSIDVCIDIGILTWTSAKRRAVVTPGAWWELTITEVKTAQWEIHNRGILFFDKIVLGEALEMKHNVGRKFLTLEPSQLASRFLRNDGDLHRQLWEMTSYLCGFPVIFGED